MWVIVGVEGAYIEGSPCGVKVSRGWYILFIYLGRVGRAPSPLNGEDVAAGWLGKYALAVEDREGCQEYTR